MAIDFTIYVVPECVTDDGIVKAPAGFEYPVHAPISSPPGPTHSTVVGDLIL